MLLERKSLGWNQTNLAKKIGVTASYISRIENGQAENIGLSVVESIASALNVSVAYLLGFTDNPLSKIEDNYEEELPIDSPPNAIAASTEIGLLLSIASELTEAQRYLLIDIARALRPQSGDDHD